MKKILTLALAIGCGAAMAQKSDNVGIGTTKPDPSALLDLNSNSKGFLLPRMSEAQRNAIKSPAIGLMIFQTDQTIGTYTYDGTTWQPSNARTAATQVAGAWDKQGNAIDATDFLGSTSGGSLRFRVNNVKAGEIGTNGTVLLGLYAGNVNTAGDNVGIGTLALSQNVSGNNNIAIGNGAMLSTTTGSSGTFNVAIGFQALLNNRGTDNLGIGTFALKSNTTGINNVALGAYAGSKNESGSNNFALGYGALLENIEGASNVAVGADALRFATGSSNLGIGAAAGRNATGSSNLFIGQSAGANETGSNKLYIANTNTATPLIGGDFANNLLKFHTGTAAPTATAGFVAIGDFTAAGSTATPGTGAINTFPAFTASSRYRLVVQDGILTEKLKVALRNGAEWADYVFAPDYQLMPLEEVEAFTKKNKHLPNVPSADDMVKDGLDVTQTSAKLMEKIEELTLYVIEMNKEIKALKDANRKLQEK